MNFVRKITNSRRLKHIVDLPKSLQDQEVELIILPLNNELTRTENILKASGYARGSLKKYANPDLIPLEKTAWKETVHGF